MLDIPNLLIKTIVAKSVILLNESGELKHYHVSYYLDRNGQFDFELKPHYQSQISIRLFHLERNETCSVSGIIFEDVDIIVSLKLCNISIVLQEKIYTIKVAATEIWQFSIHTSSVNII